MKVTKTAILLTMSASLLAACAVDPSKPANYNTQSGVAAGAILGGLIGATRPGGDNLIKGAAGAIVGGAIGGLVGQSLDAQAAELRNDIGNPNVGIVNTGNELIVTMPQDILFATDSATLRPDLTNDLYAVARNLQKYPDSTVQVIGHTDNVGASAYNQDLSQRRASSVASILISGGVPAGRVLATGRGEDQPVASNLTAEGRAQNRRVEIVIRPTN